MLEKLSEIDQRFEKLTELLIRPETVADQQQFRTLSREHSELQEIVTAYRPVSYTHLTLPTILLV